MALCFFRGEREAVLWDQLFSLYRNHLRYSRDALHRGAEIGGKVPLLQSNPGTGPQCRGNLHPGSRLLPA